MEESTKTSPEDKARRVRVPWFPTYREVRGLLAVWPGHSQDEHYQAPQHDNATHRSTRRSGRLD